MTQFKLPISYVTNTYNVDINVINDLELTNRETSLYNKALNPSTEMGCEVMKTWARQYTTNTTYLKDTQALVNKVMPELKSDYSKELEIWDNISGAKDTGAKDTGAKDTGAMDTGAKDTGAKDTGAMDTGAKDTDESCRVSREIQLH